MGQQGGGARFNNADFSDIDRAARPQALVRQQDQLNSLVGIQAYKRRMAELLALQPGDCVLDAGCGSGADLLALAPLVGPGGGAVGVDRGAVMVAQARERAAGSGLPVEFLVGDITRLDFPDATFDGCRADRVLHHLDDPARAVAELARVARPGGRIVVYEPDFEGTLIDHPNHALTRRLVDFFTDIVARNGRMARHLYALFRRQGLSAVAVEVHGAVLTDLATARGLGQMDLLLARAQEAGVLTTAEAASWMADLEAADREGCFLAATAGFLVSGHKP